MAEELRNRGMSLAETKNAFLCPLWSERAYAAIVRIARRQATVHVDDVLREFTEKPSSANAWGSVYMRCIRERLIVHSGEVRPCTVDPTKHLHRSPVYASLIYKRGH
jgi:hypothetical protein